MGPRVLFGLSLFAALSAPWVRAEASTPSASRSPTWGFESPHPLSKSLVFDLPTDHKPVRPAPLNLPRHPQEAPEAPVAHSLDVALPKQPRMLASETRESPYQIIAKPHEGRMIAALDNVLKVPATPQRAPASERSVLDAKPIEAPKAPEAQVAEVAPLAPVPTTAVADKPAPAASAPAPTVRRAVVPKVAKNQIRVLVLDEEAVLNGRLESVTDAQIEWVGVNAGLKSKVDVNGVAKGPYPLSVASRFIVRAPGYLPAVSYATAGTLSPVVLVRDSRLPAILKSLGIVPDPSKRIVLGKVLSAKLKPVAGITVDANVGEPFRSYYSMGSFGLFHTAARETGEQGDFLVTGVGAGLQYLMPTQKPLKEFDDGAREWPAHIVDMTDTPQVVTTTILESSPRTLESQVVDVFALERPETGIHVTVGGQRGVHLPDSEGELKIEGMYPRSSVDLIDLRANGYLRTWVSPIASQDYFPTSLNLFTRTHLERIFRDNIHEIPLQKGLVFGHLRPEIFNKPVQLLVFDGRGRQNREARVFYFDGNNVASPTGDRTNTLVQNFAVANLNPGEWHVVAIDPATKRGLAIQVVRTDNETISQMQF